MTTAVVCYPEKYMAWDLQDFSASGTLMLVSEIYKYVSNI